MSAEGDYISGAAAGRPLGTLNSTWHAVNEPSDIRADIEKAMRAVIEQPYEPDPCQLGRHLLHPRAWREPGVYICAACAMPVQVPVPIGLLPLAAATWPG